MNRNKDEETEGRTISLWMPSDLLAKIDAAAQADDRSRSKWICRQLREALEETKAHTPRTSSVPAAKPATVPQVSKAEVVAPQARSPVVVPSVNALVSEHANSAAKMVARNLIGRIRS
jgi:metal-responsive CopG/Arc/MetJ family transcriptional regulator